MQLFQTHIFVTCILCLSIGYEEVENLAQSPSATETVGLWRQQCTQEEILFQYRNMDLANPHICDPYVVWQFTQALFPRARTFLDAGSNLGYTAAMIFGLWSPGHGLNRKALKRAITRDGRINNNPSNGTDTFCRDGQQDDVTLLCIGRKYRSVAAQSKDGGGVRRCYTRNPVQVYSFDGDAQHVRDSERTLLNHFPHLSAHSKRSPADVGPGRRNRTATWHLINSALVGPENAGSDKGQFYTRHGEGGRFMGLGRYPPGSSAYEVPITTVDKFCAENGLEEVDVLKLDVEGAEFDVLRAANHTLRHRRVKMLTYECLELCGGSHHLKVVDDLLAMGFMCYLSGIHEMFVRLTGCWDRAVVDRDHEFFAEQPAYRLERHKRLAGNVYCGHIRRSPGLIELMEQSSLFTYADGSRGELLQDSLLSVPAVVEDGVVRAATRGAIVEWAREAGRNISTGQRLRLQRLKRAVGKGRNSGRWEWAPVPH